MLPEHFAPRPVRSNFCSESEPPPTGTGLFFVIPPLSENRDRGGSHSVRLVPFSCRIPISARTAGVFLRPEPSPHSRTVHGRSGPALCRFRPVAPTASLGRFRSPGTVPHSRSVHGRSGSDLCRFRPVGPTAVLGTLPFARDCARIPGRFMIGAGLICAVFGLSAPNPCMNASLICPEPGRVFRVKAKSPVAWDG